MNRLILFLALMLVLLASCDKSCPTRPIPPPAPADSVDHEDPDDDEEDDD
jgi:hypothetical protein